VFATRTGARLEPDNFRKRVFKPIKRANKDLEAAKVPPLPEDPIPHSQRRTFCSLLYELGESPPLVMQEMGHADAALALRVYAQAMRRYEHQQAQLRALVKGADWANMGQRDANAAPADAASAPKSANLQALRP